MCTHKFYFHNSQEGNNCHLPALTPSWKSCPLWKKIKMKWRISEYPYSWWSLSTPTWPSHHHGHNLNHSIRDWTNSDDPLWPPPHLYLLQCLHCCKSLIWLWAPLILQLSHHLFRLHFALHPAQFPQSINVLTFPWKCPHLPHVFFFLLFCPGKIQASAEPYHLTVPAFEQLILAAVKSYNCNLFHLKFMSINLKHEKLLNSPCSLPHSQDNDLNCLVSPQPLPLANSTLTTFLANDLTFYFL